MLQCGTFVLMGNVALAFKPAVEDLLARLGEQAGDIAVHCSDTGGIVARLNLQISAEAERLGGLVDAMDALNACRSERSLATQELLRTAQVAWTVLERGNTVAEQSLGEVSRLIADITGLDGQLHTFLDTIGAIGGITRTLRQIAEQTELLSFNARIEAARGGEATRPFEVLATEIRKLAVTTSESAGEVGRNVARIEETAGTLIGSLKT